MDLAEIQNQNNEPEANKTDGIVVRCYTPIGSISGFGKVEIDAREVILVDSHHVQQFVVANVTPGQDYSPTASAFIKYDDVPRMLAAIDRLMGVNPKFTKYKQIEVEFSLDDGFKMVVFNDAKGKLMFSISAQNTSVHFSELHLLNQLKALITKATSVIDENRPRAQ